MSSSQSNHLVGFQQTMVLAAALAVMACSQQPAAPQAASTPRTTQQAIGSTDRVLILGSSVTGGRQSREAMTVEAASPGTPIDVVGAEDWRTLTAQDFMTYRAIIIGDAACQSGTDAFQAALDTRKIWGSVIDGDVAIVATNAASNGTDQLVENGIRYALNSVQKRTGMYISLGCAYQDAAAGTEVTLLEPFGHFEVQGVPGCAQSGHIFEMYNDVISKDLSDELLTGTGGCAARSVFTAYPDRAFSYAGIATVSPGSMLPGQQPFTDFTMNPDVETPFEGTPYILVRGAMTKGAGCGLPEAIMPGEECDLGDGLNGQPALSAEQASETCSWSCHTDWCGDGVVNAELGEECDNGEANGRSGNSTGNMGNCTASCKLVETAPPPPPSSEPPVALCHNVTEVAEYTCGMSAGIDSGSYDPDDDLAGCTQSPEGPYAIGDTTVTLTCTDRHGHSSSCDAVVTVSDSVRPTVALAGPATQALECIKGGTYTDPGASGSDLCGGALPQESISSTGSVELGTPGAYSLSYVAKDAAGNLSDAVERAVSVSDTQAPSIALNGLANMGLECGAAYAEPGATASDLCAGNLTSAIQMTGSVNTQVPGTYAVRYNVVDPAQHAALEASRIITVSDTQKPVVTLTGAASVAVECGGTYSEQGATATDACTGPLAAVATGTADARVPGTYTISYRATDASGNTAASSRTVTVSDTLAPTLTLNGQAAQTLECGATYTEQNATASDACAGNLTASVQRTGTVDNKVLGAQTIHYSVSDGAGHSVAQDRTVTVSDTLAPTLTLNGSASQTLECGTSYVDPGASASDVCAGNLNAAIVKTGSVNKAVPGTYSLGYSVADPSGRSTSASRSVTVRDTLAPQIQVVSGPSTVQCNGSPYADPGATASDACAGDVSRFVTSTSTLDQTHAGQYAVTYRVTDAAGNTATATRPLTVAGPCTTCVDVHLSDYNLFVLEDYTNGPDVQGKVAAGGNISMQNFSVGGSLPASDISNVLVAGRNLTLTNGSIWGNAFYGNAYSANQGVTSRRGTVAKGSPIDFAAKFTELRSTSSKLAALTANGTTTRESWGGIFLRGTSTTTNVFNVAASAFTGAAQFNINVPAGSLVVVNIRGASATFQNFGYVLTGADAHTILYNFVDATTINASSFGFRGTVLAPYARMTFNNGSWDGGIYAVSMNGTAEGHLNVLYDRSICP